MRRSLRHRLVVLVLALASLASLAMPAPASAWTGVAPQHVQPAAGYSGWGYIHGSGAAVTAWRWTQAGWIRSDTSVGTPAWLHPWSSEWAWAWMGGAWHAVPTSAAAVWACSAPTAQVSVAAAADVRRFNSSSAQVVAHLAAGSTVTTSCSNAFADASGDARVFLLVQAAGQSGYVDAAAFRRSGTAAQCGSSLQQQVDALPAGAVLDLGSCVFDGSLDARRPITIVGGTIRRGPGQTAVTVNADDVTIDGTRFEGGGVVVRVLQRDRFTVRNSTFVGQTETSIRLDGPSVDDALIEGNRIVQSVRTNHGYSPISGAGFGRGLNSRLVIRGNLIDQGPPGVAWFGIEVWDNAGLVIEGNDLRGAGTLISIPRSDGAVIRGNRFDMTQANWGIELADVDGAVFSDNVATGSGAAVGGFGWGWVQLHPGSGTVRNITIVRNRLSDYYNFVNLEGSGHTITDNCLNRVQFESRFQATGPITWARNGPC